MFYGWFAICVLVLVCVCVCWILKSSKTIKKNIKRVTWEINNAVNLACDRMPVISGSNDENVFRAQISAPTMPAPKASHIIFISFLWSTIKFYDIGISSAQRLNACLGLVRKFRETFWTFVSLKPKLLDCPQSTLILLLFPEKNTEKPWK